MGSLEQITKGDYVPIVHGNSQAQFISYNHRGNPASFNANTLFQGLPATIIDDGFYASASIDLDINSGGWLFLVYNHSITPSLFILKAVYCDTTSTD